MFEIIMSVGLALATFELLSWLGTEHADSATSLRAGWSWEDHRRAALDKDRAQSRARNLVDHFQVL